MNIFYFLFLGYKCFEIARSKVCNYIISNADLLYMLTYWRSMLITKLIIVPFIGTSAATSPHPVSLSLLFG